VGRAVGAEVGWRWLDAQAAALMPQTAWGRCIDDAPFRQKSLAEAAQSLSSAGPVVSQRLYSELLRSLCPVTAQPDWATLVVEYTGPALDEASLLAYVVAYRGHQGFHEQCVERIFLDLWRRCNLTALTVYARYTRRGGIDINPLRCTAPKLPGMGRTWRQ
jgi:7-cyano-7-deazaguanine reductase